MRVAVLAMGVLLAGCATPAAEFLADAAKRGLSDETFGTGAETLVVFRKGTVVAGEPVHVYFDGDGAPLRSRTRPNADPTTRTRLILDLIQSDSAASLLIGRPCYYQKHSTCEPSQWTAARYNEAVVSVMSAAVRHALAAWPDSPVVLIGYSGGGTLAMLIAPRLHRVDRVFTIAANLDVTAWAKHHGYPALADSLNPAEAPPLPASVRQMHWFGERDSQVPPEVMQPAVERQPNAHSRVVAGFDHACCWAAAWPGMLEEGLAGRP